MPASGWRRQGMPVVATNGVCFLEDANSLRTRSGSASTRDARSTIRARLAYSPAAIPALTSRQMACCSPTCRRRCTTRWRSPSAATSRSRSAELPAGFSDPAGMTIDEFFRAESRKGLEWRLKRILDPVAEDFAERRKPYDERLEIELDVITTDGVPGLLPDRRRLYPVGQGQRCAGGARAWLRCRIAGRLR